MTVFHRFLLYALLGLLCFSLVVPGVMELFRTPGTKNRPVAQTMAAGSQLRVFNGMMVGMGLVAFWCLIDLAGARSLVMALGVMLVPVVIGRIYSIVVDGLPDSMTWGYLFIELIMAWVFLAWPPPVSSG